MEGQMSKNYQGFLLLMRTLDNSKIQGELIENNCMSLLLINVERNLKDVTTKS